jgi:pimeloyl-ACP methyl ester carboxylesterase
VSCPTLILHARHDRRVPIEQAREIASLVPDSRVRLLDSGNHIVMADEPAWPEMLAELEDFLDGC